ncbi:flagellar protein FlaG [Sporomusa termitida]|uniref:FlaG protein n=1 Tax=Sporomusa termitida TaxID=2377 RepID=A0A517DX61_9FIRM|nr:flagellar protein FlaG [Sporomusa termitida]QDR81942.1 FlaG protein [Sporomusa termitida]
MNSLKPAEAANNFNSKAYNPQLEGKVSGTVEQDLLPGKETEAEGDRKKLEEMSAEMTKFMQLANSDLQFELHEGTQQLIVQVVDIKTNTVLKEFPPHEFLDTIAKIREFVGFLLDKKA